MWSKEEKIEIHIFLCYEATTPPTRSGELKNTQPFSLLCKDRALASQHILFGKMRPHTAGLLTRWWLITNFAQELHE